MKRFSSNFQPILTLLNISKQHFYRLPLLIWLNSLIIIALGLLSLYAKLKSKGRNIETLFDDPFDVGIFYLGWFTGIAEVLWCIAIAICLFTTSLLPKLSRQSKQFFFCSALLMALLYCDDRFRLTLLLGAFFGNFIKVKVTVYFAYGFLTILYSITFWHIIRKTPYLPLLISFCLFAFSSLIDITPMAGRGMHAMLEDGTKLVGLLNLTVYFWYICRLEIQKSLPIKLTKL